MEAGLVGVDDWERLGLTPDGQIALEGLLAWKGISWCRPRSYLQFLFGNGGGVGKVPGASRASWVARVLEGAQRGTFQVRNGGPVGKHPRPSSARHFEPQTSTVSN